MEGESDDTMKFVMLLEDHKILLNKSQMISKNKKHEAVSSIIEKWAALSNKTLKEAAVLKKISNLKVRTNKAVNIGQPLTDWQQKVMDLTKGPENDSNIPGDSASQNNDSTMAVTKPTMGQSKMKAEDIVGKYETESTKLLSNEQLQRIILLQQVEVLTLKRKKLLQEMENGAMKANTNVGDCINMATAQVVEDATIEVIGWDENNHINGFEV